MNDNSAILNGCLSSIQNHGHDTFLVNLYQRWQMEKEYEGFEEYDKAIRTSMGYLNIIKVTKRPFGIKAAVGAKTVSVGVYAKGRYLKIVAKIGDT